MNCVIVPATVHLPKLIGIAGLAGTGKDTLAAHLRARYGYRVRAFADPIRQLLSARFNWDPELWNDRGWKESVSWANDCGPFSPRGWMQWLGTEVLRRYAGHDIFVRLAFQDWDHQTPMVLSDLRFNNEAEAIIERGGVVLQLVRHGVGPISSHVSESGVNPSLIHGTLVNNGTIEQLGLAAERMIETLWEGLQRQPQLPLDFGAVPR